MSVGFGLRRRCLSNAPRVLHDAARAVSSGCAHKREGTLNCAQLICERVETVTRLLKRSVGSVSLF